MRCGTANAGSVAGAVRRARMGREQEAHLDEDGVKPDVGTKGRLFITEMVMENFKSYAGVQHVGPFHKCFSAVVGPNGSGKSNVIDAMLFVFGKRAKQMRLNKVSELIHNSTNHQNLEKARVSVHFQEIVDLDDESYAPVPGTDFVITRVAFRNNSSQYFINDRSSTFTEVTKKLKAKGVDLDNNRFLILQGEVEQISLMKPKAQTPHDEGFLEYLEDIIGSNQYVQKIEEASKMLEELNDKRGSMVNRVKIAEKEKDGLQDAKDEAQTYLLKEAELMRWRGKAVELALEDATSKVGHFNDVVALMDEQLKQGREKLEKHSKDMAELETKYKQENKCQEELETEVKRCSEQFKDFERQDLKYREDLKHLKQKTKKLDEKILKDTAKIDEMEKDIEQATVAIPTLEAEITKLSEQLVGDEKKLESLVENSKDEVEQYRKELAGVRTELEPWEKQLAECQSIIDLTTTKRKLLQDKHDAGRVAYVDAQRTIEDLANKIVDKESIHEKLKVALTENQSLAKDGHSEEQACQKEEESVALAEQAARQRLNELRGTMESERSQGSVLKAILQAKESGAISGIYGRLGDLGAIDAKYDVAISTACGALDYVVVETTTAAQTCVELLRSNGLGVATFFIMEKQQEHIRRMNQSVRTPEGVPRLFDLVTVRDAAIKLAFFVNLGNTVVAKDLDQATRIAYGPDKEFSRVVTVDGVMFEKSGTMSGGGGKPRGGKMGTSIRAASVSPEAIRNAEGEVASVGDQLRALRSRRNAAVQQYQTAEKAISQLELNIQKSRMEIEGLSVQKEDLIRRLQGLKVEANPKKDELDKVKELEKSLAESEANQADLKNHSKHLREKVRDLQQKMEDAGGDVLKKQRALVERFQKDIDSKGSEINRKKVQITTNTKTIQKLKKGIEEATAERTRCFENKETKSIEFKEIEKRAFDVQEKYNHLLEVLEKQRQQVEAIKQHYVEAKQIIEGIRSAEVDAQYKLEDNKKLALEWDSKSKHLQKKQEDTERDLSKHVEKLREEEVNPQLIEAVLTFNFDPAMLKNAAEVAKKLEVELKEMKPNLNAIAEFRSKAAQYGERVAELNFLTQERDQVKKTHDDLRKQRLDEFMTGFNLISMKLKEMYQMITLGGDAELELVDSLDPFAEGVVFSVRPPKKSWKNISNLSGGEKTLSSLALVFALHHYKPTPLYVMDEIDAALDFKNVSIVGHYIKERTKNAQFVIISLRNNMFELADRLIGIYKTDNCTKSLTINPSSFSLNPKY